MWILIFQNISRSSWQWTYCQSVLRATTRTARNVSSLLLYKPPFSPLTKANSHCAQRNPNPKHRKHKNRDNTNGFLQSNVRRRNVGPRRRYLCRRRSGPESDVSRHRRFAVIRRRCCCRRCCSRLRFFSPDLSVAHGFSRLPVWIFSRAGNLSSISI